jgi:hypothetical protein
MRSRQRRLKTIELDLTPQQVVVLWLRNALQSGTFEEGARRTPPPPRGRRERGAQRREK